MMKLNGGLNTYVGFVNGKQETEKRYLNNESPCGRKVKYLGEGGWDWDKDYARERGLDKGEIYTVNEIYVGRSSSTVTLLEVEGEFNTVMFEDVSIIIRNEDEHIKFMESLHTKGDN